MNLDSIVYFIACIASFGLVYLMRIIITYCVESALSSSGVRTDLTAITDELKFIYDRLKELEDINDHLKEIDNNIRSIKNKA